MITKLLLTLILGFNSILLLLNYVYLQHNGHEKPLKYSLFTRVDEYEEDKEVMTFDDEISMRTPNFDGFLNGDLLQKLGFYQKMPVEYYNYKDNGKLLSHVKYIGIKHNQQYCKTADLYNIQHPENVFNTMNFITDYSGQESLIRKEIMTKIGKDVMPMLTMFEKDKQIPKYDLAINGTMIFLKRAMIHAYYEINKDWICQTQMYNHIPGNGVITRKDLLVETINSYLKKYNDKPHCIQTATFAPQAYRLNDESECQEFFGILNSDKYEQNKIEDPVQYLIKLGNGPHRAMGLFLMDEKMEVDIREQYQNGEKCGIEQKSYVAQKYISNPLLLDKQNKFDFRIYMLIASTNPLIVYYHDGFLRVSLSKYEKESKEKNVHFTNTHLSKEIFAKAKGDKLYDGMTENELRDYQMWTMEDLQRYLLQSGKIYDENWLNNYLRPKFKEAFIHIARMSEKGLYKSSGLFEMFGLDFVMDEETNIWLIECNPSPQLIGTTEKKTKFLVQMLTDLFEVQYAYFRSRMKRIYKFFGELSVKVEAGKSLNYPELAKQFAKINMNKLEKEFEIDSNNSFSLIMDKNLQGSKAYFGFLTDDCSYDF